MTLKELLNSCDFKEIAPFIVKNYPEHEYMLTDYKMAFDILRNMKPEINPDHNIKEIKIEWGYDGSKKYISVYSCEGDYWQSSLAKEIMVSDELTLSDHEIAAHCLWSLTFYGFCESDCDELFNSLGDLEKRFPSREIKIEKAIQTLTSNTESFTREDLLYLFNTNRIWEGKYQSYSFNAQQRINYLIDLLSNYEYGDFSKYTHFFLMIRYSSNYPLMVSEIERLSVFFEKFLPETAEIKIGRGKDETLGTEMGLFLLGSY